MKQFAVRFKTYFKNLHAKMFLNFLFPIVFIVVAFFINSQYFVHYLGEQTENHYKESLQNISEEINNQMKEVVETSILLSNSPDLKQVFYSNEVVSPVNRYQLTNVISTLITFKSTKSLIRSTFIIQKSNGFVISTQGVFSNDDFFHTYYHYDRYPENFWLTTKSNGLNYQILNPARVKDQLNNSTSDVIPILEYGIGLEHSNNLLVINVDENSIANMLQTNKITKNSELYVFNTENQLVSSSGNRAVSSLADFPQELRHPGNGLSTCDVKMDGQNFLAVCWLPELDFLKNFKFVAMVPYSDMQEYTFPLRVLSQVLMILFLFMGIVYSYWTSKKLYNPIRQLTSLFRSNKTGSAPLDEFEFLNTQIRDMINSNELLSKQLSETIPYACEKYLLNAVQNNVDISEEELLSKFNVSFPYGYFITSIVWIDYRDTLYENYTADQISEVTKLIPKILIDSLDPDGKYYVLSMPKNRFCLLANIQDASMSQSAVQALRKLVNLFQVDQDYIRIYAAVGNPYRGFIGIHQSYQEAEQMCALFSPFNPEKVISYRRCCDSPRLFLTAEDENKLFNYLMSGNREGAREHLTSILTCEDAENAEEHYRKDLYLQIYNVCLRALDCRKISPRELMGNSYIDIIREGDIYSVSEICAYLDQLVEQITGVTKKDFIRPELSEIKQYIGTHYQEDLYLEVLAEKYGIPVKYMSKLLKDALGKPFKKYLTDLRIAKAKELLESRKQGIDEIGACVGFNSRTTFIRAFKLHEGITPTEYRSLIRKRKT